MSIDKTFDYLDTAPMCFLSADIDTGKIIKVNRTFEKLIGSMDNFDNCEFWKLAADSRDDEYSSRLRLKKVMRKVMTSEDTSEEVRDVEMFVFDGEESVPGRRHFDWKVWRSPNHELLLFGDPCGEKELKQRAREAELIDFFENAPIAMHWLNRDGIILWANQMELDVLGYTAEEYIGQPIMKFCPDEDHVLDTFNHVENGKTKRDIPFRLQSKDGKISYYLIDYNVAYNRDGSFGHTRCVLRDDTQRKMREERSRLLLEETRRSLKMLDRFMSRSLHHIRLPLHVMQTTCDIVADNIRQEQNSDFARIGDEESLRLLDEASQEIHKTMKMIDNIFFLFKFEQGAEPNICVEIVDLKAFAINLFNELKTNPSQPDVALQLDIEGGGPELIRSDPMILKRALECILENAIEATKQGYVKLRIAFQNRRYTFLVEDSGPGLPMDKLPCSSCHNSDEQCISPIFQRYYHSYIPHDVVDYEEAENIRQQVETSINSSMKNNLGLGLSLSYCLVRALGSELRYNSESGKGAQFWFCLPKETSQIEDCGVLEQEKHSKEYPITSQSSFEKMCKNDNLVADDHIDNIVNIVPLETRGFVHFQKKRSFDDVNVKGEAYKKTCISRSTTFPPPSVLIVEDSDVCAKMLRMLLTLLNCVPSRAENGQVAINMLMSEEENKFSLILMDLRMPIMDGFQATKIIKRDLKLKIPIVALTGEVDEVVKEECKGIEFSEICHKPMKLSGLKDVIQRHIGYSCQMQTIAENHDK